jgi:aminoglycoside 6-adenylyltransferase
MSESRRSDELLHEITEWADARADVVAAVLTGSRAADGTAVDEFSDLDVELFTTDPSLYVGTDWLDELGWVMVCLPFDDEGDGYTTRLVFFTDGVKVDFQIRRADHLDAIAAGSTEDEVWGRGFRFLIDKVGARSAKALCFSTPPNEPVTADDFRRVVNEFWFEAAHIPRYLLRGELWVVKLRDWTMKTDLLKMIEWHARATQGDQVDVWYIGTKMRNWAEAEVWDDVHHVFGRFDRADSWRALLATVQLFDRIARDVAKADGFEYPVAAERVQAYVHSFAERLDAESTSA